METIEDIMFACCILHNMIVNDEHDVPKLENILAQYMGDNAPMRRGISFEDFATSSNEIHDKTTHYNLCDDLIKHLWKLKGVSVWA